MIDQEELHNLCLSDYPKERILALEQLKNFFSSIPDKQKASDDLHRLTNDKYDYVRSIAAETLGHVFSHVPDKQQAWNDLHRLTYDEDSWVRETVAQALGFAFSHIPDKQLAWDDLHRLNNDEDSLVRSIAAENLCSAFSHMPDKQLAWNDLHRLNNDEESGMRRKAAEILGSAFSQIPDIQQAWSDLHRLTYDEDSYVRREVAYALGSVFSQVPDKQLAWSDLHKLTDDEDSDVRTYAFHSLGRVSVFKSTKTKTEKDYRKELENAIYFFGIVAHNYYYDMVNPSKFCLPFYRSFHTIIFKKQDPRKEVDRYLVEAKDAAKGSKSKELLFEAVENLANALTEVQNMENMDLEAMKGELNSYRKYCDRVEEIMKNTEEDVPFAVKTMRIGSHILDRNLKKLIEEIQKKAQTACRESIGNVKEIACSVSREVQKWEIGSQQEMTQMIENLAYILEEKISVQSKNKYILGKIDQMKSERILVRQYEILAQIIPLIRNVTVVSDETVMEGFEDIKKGISKIDAKIDEMIVSLKPGPRAELVISMGLKALGSGTQGVITIPLKEIDYPELPMDLEKIKGKFLKVSELPGKLFDKVQGYLH